MMPDIICKEFNKLTLRLQCPVCKTDLAVEVLPEQTGRTTCPQCNTELIAICRSLVDGGARYYKLKELHEEPLHRRVYSILNEFKSTIINKSNNHE